MTAPAPEKMHHILCLDGVHVGARRAAEVALVLRAAQPARADNRPGLTGRGIHTEGMRTCMYHYK